MRLESQCPISPHNLAQQTFALIQVLNLHKVAQVTWECNSQVLSLEHWSMLCFSIRKSQRTGTSGIPSMLKDLDVGNPHAVGLKSAARMSNAINTDNIMITEKQRG